MSTAPTSNRTTPDRHPCEASLLGGSVWSRHTYACGKTAKVERDGKWYCGIHDPVRVAAKRAERDAEYARKCTERSAKWSMERAAPDLLAALKAVVHRTELGTALFHKLTEENAEQALAAIAKAEGR